MSAESILAGRCRHAIPLGEHCSQCMDEAERRELLIRLHPYAAKKSGNQKHAYVPLELMRDLVAWLGAK